jgi:hypothetical protein
MPSAQGLAVSRMPGEAQLHHSFADGKECGSLNHGLSNLHGIVPCPMRPAPPHFVVARRSCMGLTNG